MGMVDIMEVVRGNINEASKDVTVPVKSGEKCFWLWQNNWSKLTGLKSAESNLTVADKNYRRWFNRGREHESYEIIMQKKDLRRIR